MQHVADCFAQFSKECDRRLLIEYGDRLGNDALFKRLGFLAAQHPHGDVLIDQPRGKPRCRARAPNSALAADALRRQHGERVRSDAVCLPLPVRRPAGCDRQGARHRVPGDRNAPDINKAGLTRAKASTAAVTLTQRFGSVLN